MAYTLEQFIRETHEMVIDEAIRSDPDALLQRFAPEERIKGLDPEEVLKRFDAEERLKGLDPEARLKGLDPEERLKGLDLATIEAWLAKQKPKS